MEPLKTGTVLQDKYEIVAVLGWTEATAAYVVRDVDGTRQYLLWESPQLFRLTSKPPGALEYLQQGGKHYLVLTPVQQTLAFVLTMAGRLEEMTAGLWMLQICRSIGYWHNRDSGALICLRQGPLSLKDFHLSDVETVNMASYGELGRGVAAGQPEESTQFFSPETERDRLSPASDVYALGALLYCLLTGLRPPEPAVRQAKPRPVSPRQYNRDLSRDMEKVVCKALEMDPRRRYADAGKMADALEAFLLPALKKPQQKRKPSLLVGSLLFFLMLALCVAAVVYLDSVVERPPIRLPWMASTPVVPPPLTGSVSLLSLNQVSLDQLPNLAAYVSLVDAAGLPLACLDPALLQAMQDGTPITDFQLAPVDAGQDPLSSMVTMGVGGDADPASLQEALGAAATLVDGLVANGPLGIIQGGDPPQLAQGWTTSSAEANGALRSLDPGQKAALYDGLGEALDWLAGKKGRRAAILLCTVPDTASISHTPDNLLEQARKEGIPVFVAAVEHPSLDIQGLSRLANDSGGQFYAVKSAQELQAAVAQILQQLESQCCVKFASRHDRDDQWHDLALGVQLGDGQEMWDKKDYWAAVPLNLEALAQAILNQVRIDQFPQIIAYTSVLDRLQEPFLGLSAANFRVQQDHQEVTEFRLSNVDAALDPLSIVVAFDISGSMRGEPIEKARAAAANFVGRFDAGDAVCLVKFDDRIEMVHDFITDKATSTAAINALQTRGDTALYDVVVYSAERLATRTGRRVVVVLTDGRDTASKKHTLDSAIAQANGVGIPVFVLGLDSEQFTPQVMERLSGETGGSYLFAPTPDELDALYQKIRGQLQNQYRLEFTSLHPQDQAPHTLTIGVFLAEGHEIWSEREYTLP